MWDYVWVGLGTAIGGVARYWCSGVVARRFGERFPWGTLVVNVGGSFVIGFFGGLSGAGGRFFVDPAVRQFVMVGICGGFTTFSSFSLQTLNLARDGEWLRVMGNIVLSVLACLLSVWLGDAAARALLGTMMEGA